MWVMRGREGSFSGRGCGSSGKDLGGGLMLWREGRKKGAFSGGLGGSVGLFLARIVSRWRRVCQRDLGTRLKVWRVLDRASGSEVVGRWRGRGGASSESDEEEEESKAASMMPWPASPDVVGETAGMISPSWRGRVGTWVKRVRLFQRFMLTVSAWAVARYSPVSENARAVQGLCSRRALIKWPVGRSQTRITESMDAAMIQRTSFEKLKSLIWPKLPQSYRTVFLVSVSTTRIDMSSQLKASKSLVV